jgi:hypothetical protein
MAKRGVNRAKVLAALPGSNADVRQRTGLSLATTHRWLKDLLDAGDIHVHHMEVHPHGGPLIHVYHPGPAPARYTIKMPKLTTDADRVKRYRRGLKKNGGWEDLLAKSRAYYWTKKKPQRDPLTAALFGAST